jgi:hypothetical protein
MIGRRTAQAIGDAYNAEFTYRKRLSTGQYHTYVDHDRIYDFLYGQDYAAWICNAVRNLTGDRGVKDWVMKLHTGETLLSMTTDWTWEQRETLGQQVLTQLARDIVVHDQTVPDRYGREEVSASVGRLVKLLELEGYLFRDGMLLQPEGDVIDVEETRGILEHLYTTLGLGEKETAIHHLDLSEEHFLAGKWDDAISNSRKFLELVLSKSAAAHSTRANASSVSTPRLDSPAAVREYLQAAGVLEAKEKDAIAKVYGLLSQTGGHPYMAAHDQARLLRQLSLTLAQFVMLRLRGSLSAAV